MRSRKNHPVGPGLVETGLRFGDVEPRSCRLAHPTHGKSPFLSHQLCRSLPPGGSKKSGTYSYEELFGRPKQESSFPDVSWATVIGDEVRKKRGYHDTNDKNSTTCLFRTRRPHAPLAKLRMNATPSDDSQLDMPWLLPVTALRPSLFRTCVVGKEWQWTYVSCLLSV
jgi:hypothetical protein